MNYDEQKPNNILPPVLHKANISVCCNADMIPPDWDALEKDGSLWPASACYICKSCGKLCEPIGVP
jgi:hypothetical protein